MALKKPELKSSLNQMRFLYGTIFPKLQSSLNGVVRVKDVLFPSLWLK